MPPKKSSSDMRRCIVFAHYDRDQLIDEHVLHLLKALRPHAEQLIFISVSASEEQLTSLDGLCDAAITRENIGYDFMSWKRGLAHISNLESLDEVLFVNDSIYGPLHDLRQLFEKADRVQCDFWGLTRCHEIQQHIQSFFFAFRKSLIDNGVFQAFWATVEPLADKREIIHRYEVGMTAFVETRGATTAHIFDQRELTLRGRLQAAFSNGRRKEKSRLTTLRRYLKGKVTNPMHGYWRSVIDSGVPFLKVELLRDNPRRLPHAAIYRYLEQQSDYDLAVIHRHLQRVSRLENSSRNSQQI